MRERIWSLRVEKENTPSLGHFFNCKKPSRYIHDSRWFGDANTTRALECRHSGRCVYDQLPKKIKIATSSREPASGPQDAQKIGELAGGTPFSIPKEPQHDQF